MYDLGNGDRFLGAFARGRPTRGLFLRDGAYAEVEFDGVEGIHHHWRAPLPPKKQKQAPPRPSCQPNPPSPPPTTTTTTTTRCHRPTHPNLAKCKSCRHLQPSLGKEWPSCHHESYHEHG